MDEFIIQLLAQLDTSKAIQDYNDLKQKLEKQINIKVNFDFSNQKDISRLAEQLQTALSKISNGKLNVDTSQITSAFNQVVKDAQQTGTAIKKSVQQSLSIDSIIDKQVSNLMEKYSITGKKGSKAFEEIKQAIVNYRKELIEANNTPVDPDDIFSIFGNSADIGKVTTALTNHMKVVDETKGSYQGLAEYIKAVNNSGAKIHLPESIRQEYGDDFSAMRSQLGKAFTTGNGGDFETFIVELNTQLGNVIDMSHGAETAFGDLVSKVNSSKGSNFLSGDELFKTGLLDKSEIESSITSIIDIIESEEQKLAQSSTASTDTIIQNEERKQQAYQETSQKISQDLSKTENVINSFKNSLSNAGKSSTEIESIIKEVESLNVQIDSLRFSESTNGFMKLDVSGLDEFGNKVKITQSLVQDLQTMAWGKSDVTTSIVSTKEIENISNAFVDFTQKLAQFKSTNSEILSGLSAPISEFESKLSGLKNGTATIDEVVNSYKSLNTEASKITENFSRQLSPIDSAIRKLASGEETIAGLRAEIKGLDNSPKELNSELNKCASLLENIKKIESEQGRSADWSKVYRQWSDSLDLIQSKLKTLKKEQSNVASTQIFNTSDLKADNIAYITKVYNTIEKQMSSIQSMARNKGWEVVDVSGVEQADGKIKQLTLTVKDAEGALKKLTMQREKLQGNGKAQYGLMQVGDVKVIETATQAQEKLAQSAEKANAKLAEQANKIQLSIETGGYESKVESLIAKTQQWTDANGNARISTNELSNAFNQLTTASNNYANSPTEAHQKALIASEKELDKQIKTVTNSVRSMNAELAKDSKISSLHNQLADFMSKNGKTVKYFGNDLRDIFNQTAQGSKLTNQELAVLKQRFIDIQNVARNTGKLGKTFFQTLREGMSSFSYWTSSTFLIMKTIQKIKEAVTFSKELNSALVNINYTMDVTASQLENIGNKSINMAKDLHTSAENVLGAVKLYANAKETADSILAKAQPAIMLSNVTGFSGEESAKYLQTIMNQFDLTQDDLMNISDTIQGISQSMAHDFADGIVQINEGIATSGEIARAAGMDLADYASMIGLLVEKTGLAGSQLGNSLKTIITRTTKAGKIMGIDEGEISAAETSLRSIGVEVRKTDGEFNAFNDTMNELAKHWDSLSDVEKSNISFNLAGTRQINVIQTLLRNWNEYEDLVNKANSSTGVTFENQEKYAASLEGKLKELSATTTSIGDNIFKSDDLSVIVNGLTKIAGLFDIITSKTKLLGTIGLGAGIFAGLKNVGMAELY